MNSYYASVGNATTHVLGTLRRYSQLSVAWSGTTLWVSGLNIVLMNDVTVKSIPGLQCYAQLSGLLFPIGSQLPYGPVPSLPWQPICDALPVSLPAFNHHFFHLTDTVPVALVPSVQEQSATAMLVSCATLVQYVHTAPAIRLSALLWVVIDADEALLIGSPLLPLPANIFWRRGHVLLPVGVDYEFPHLSAHIENALNPKASGWVLHRPDGSWLMVPFSSLVPLSRASVRGTLSALYATTL